MGFERRGQGHAVGAGVGGAGGGTTRCGRTLCSLNRVVKIVINNI
jgi:hypothetical protein